MTTDNHDPFALGGDQRDDAALFTLFREWRAGMRDIEGPRPAEETEDQYDVANSAVWDIARQIYDTPAAGPVGLAIKAFMLAFGGQYGGEYPGRRPALEHLGRRDSCQSGLRACRIRGPRVGAGRRQQHRDA